MDEIVVRGEYMLVTLGVLLLECSLVVVVGGVVAAWPDFLRCDLISDGAWLASCSETSHGATQHQATDTERDYIRHRGERLLQVLQNYASFVHVLSLFTCFCIHSFIWRTFLCTQIRSSDFLGNKPVTLQLFCMFVNSITFWIPLFVYSD